MKSRKLTQSSAEWPQSDRWHGLRCESAHCRLPGRFGSVKSVILIKNDKRKFSENDTDFRKLKNRFKSHKKNFDKNFFWKIYKFLVFRYFLHDSSAPNKTIYYPTAASESSNSASWKAPCTAARPVFSSQSAFWECWRQWLSFRSPSEQWQWCCRRGEQLGTALLGSFGGKGRVLKRKRAWWRNTFTFKLSHSNWK